MGLPLTAAPNAGGYGKFFMTHREMFGSDDDALEEEYAVFINSVSRRRNLFITLMAHFSVTCI